MDITGSHFSNLPSVASPVGPSASMRSSSRIPMRHTPAIVRRGVGSSGRQPSFNPTAVGERTCSFLRHLYPSRTVDNVTADLTAWGVKSSTIAKMLERSSTPSTPLLIALTFAYGPEFLCAVLDHPPAWLSAAHRADRQQQIEASIAALKSELDGLR